MHVQVPCTIDTITEQHHHSLMGTGRLEVWLPRTISRDKEPVCPSVLVRSKDTLVELESAIVQLVWIGVPLK